MELKNKRERERRRGGGEGRGGRNRETRPSRWQEGALAAPPDGVTARLLHAIWRRVKGVKWPTTLLTWSQMGITLPALQMPPFSGSQGSCLPPWGWLWIAPESQSPPRVHLPDSWVGDLSRMGSALSRQRRGGSERKARNQLSSSKNYF